MKRRTHISILSLATVFSLLVFLIGCSSSSKSSTTSTIAITAQSGAGQGTPIGQAFANPLVANVTSNGTAASGVTVTFSAAASTGASCTLSSTTATTDGNGNASVTCTADSTAGTYTVTATATGASTPATFSLTNGTPYAFYVSGLEAIDGGQNYYAIAGAVALDTSGNVVGGEEDYNDGYKITQTDVPISGGKLSLNSSGQGTLTLNTPSTGGLGASGVETFGVQFVNTNHAIIIQFDGSATSSGSLDMQTVAAPSNGYAFTLSGIDYNYNPVAFGGVFAVSGSGNVSGTADVNDSGTVATGKSFTGAFATADAYGRGQITGVTVNGVALTLAYYIVGPEAIRIIDVDTPTSGMGNAAVGSAFGQGSNGTSAGNSSVANSVFGIAGDPLGELYDAVGMLTPSASGGTFTGVGDDDETGNVVSASSTTGTYTVGTNGYGSLAITGLGDVANLGLYVTDPNLNLSDPNNTSGGGGALLVDLDDSLAGGTGVMIPQTDTTATDFSGNYAFGAQAFTPGSTGYEFDYVGQGSLSSGAFTGTGLVSDPFGTFAATSAEYSGVSFGGTFTPDADEATTGRYTTPLTIAVAGSQFTETMVIYQASGGELFWMDESTSGTSFGTLQQQTSLTGLPAVRKTASKAQTGRKH